MDYLQAIHKTNPAELIAGGVRWLLKNTELSNGFTITHKVGNRRSVKANGPRGRAFKLLACGEGLDLVKDREGRFLLRAAGSGATIAISREEAVRWFVRSFVPSQLRGAVTRTLQLASGQRKAA